MRHNWISACTTSAQNKNSHIPPAGLLQPLPIPPRPWSDIYLAYPPPTDKLPFSLKIDFPRLQTLFPSPNSPLRKTPQHDSIRFSVTWFTYWHGFWQWSTVCFPVLYLCNSDLLASELGLNKGLWITSWSERTVTHACTHAHTHTHTHTQLIHSIPGETEENPYNDEEDEGDGDEYCHCYACALHAEIRTANCGKKKTFILALISKLFLWQWKSYVIQNISQAAERFVFPVNYHINA